MAMTTEEMVALSLEMSGIDALPADSEVIVPGGPISRLAVAIDLDASELMLAKHLGCDGALTHHPRGPRSLIQSPEALRHHAVLMKSAGVPDETADRLADDLVTRGHLAKHTTNYDAVVAPAKLVGLPFVGLHTPLDELGRRRMQEKVDAVVGADPDATVGDVVEGLYDFGEFKNAVTRIEIRHGSAEGPAGKVHVCHGAACNGGFAVAEACFEAGVDTLVYIHVRPADLARIRAETTGTLIVTGHIASDSLGINPFLDALRERGVECMNFGGIIPAEGA